MLHPKPLSAPTSQGAASNERRAMLTRLGRQTWAGERANSSNNAFASLRSRVSNPVNHPAKLQHANFSGADLSNADFAGADNGLALRLHGAGTSKDLGALDARHLPQPLARRRENRVPNRRRNSAAISAAKRGSLICSGMRTRRRKLV